LVVSRNPSSGVGYGDPVVNNVYYYIGWEHRCRDELSAAHLVAVMIHMMSLTQNHGKCKAAMPKILTRSYEFAFLTAAIKLFITEVG
jgi:hypothetical protein